MRSRHVGGSAAYDMQSAVLVDVIEQVDFEQRPSSQSVSVIPSVVRLQELDSTTLPPAKSSDLAPLAGVLTAVANELVVEDREGGFGGVPASG